VLQVHQRKRRAALRRAALRCTQTVFLMRPARRGSGGGGGGGGANALFAYTCRGTASARTAEATQSGQPVLVAAFRTVPTRCLRRRASVAVR